MKEMERKAEHIRRIEKTIQSIAGHIREPYTLEEICEILEGSEYSAELMLQHTLLSCLAAERRIQRLTEWIRSEGERLDRLQL